MSGICSRHWGNHPDCPTCNAAFDGPKADKERRGIVAIETVSKQEVPAGYEVQSDGSSHWPEVSLGEERDAYFATRAEAIAACHAHRDAIRAEERAATLKFLGEAAAQFDEDSVTGINLREWVDAIEALEHLGADTTGDA